MKPLSVNITRTSEQWYMTLYLKFEPIAIHVCFRHSVELRVKRNVWGRDGYDENAAKTDHAHSDYEVCYHVSFIRFNASMLTNTYLIYFQKCLNACQLR